jgi:hypothetical protein
MLPKEIPKLTSSGPIFFFKIPTFCMIFKDICERLVHFLDWNYFVQILVKGLKSNFS